jgi:hypothetical protein
LVALCGLPEPFGAEFRDSLLGIEVDVDDPEPIAVPVDPLEVVLRADAGRRRSNPSVG